MVQYPLDKPSCDIGVCTSSVLPLRIHLDQNDIILLNQPAFATVPGIFLRLIKHQTLVTHQVQKAVQSLVIVVRPVGYGAIAHHVNIRPVLSHCDASCLLH